MKHWYRDTVFSHIAQPYDTPNYQSSCAASSQTHLKAMFTLQDFKPDFSPICKLTSSPTGQAVIGFQRSVASLLYLLLKVGSTSPHPWHCMPVVRGTPAGGRGIRCRPQHARTPALGVLLPEETRGLTTGWRLGGIPEWFSYRPSRDSAVKPVLKWSHMKNTKQGYCGCHMPQEPLK